MLLIVGGAAIWKRSAYTLREAPPLSHRFVTVFLVGILFYGLDMGDMEILLVADGGGVS